MKIQRVLTSIVLIPIAIGITWLSGWWFVATICIISTLAVVEACKISKKAGQTPQVLIILLANLALQIVAYFKEWVVFAGIIFLFLATLYAFEIFKGSPAGALPRIGSNLFILGLGLLFVFLTLLEFSAPDNIGGFAGWRLVATLLAGVWSFDIFSYFGGMLLGRHALAPNISPGKTWEGFIIGSIFGAGAFVVSGIYLVQGALPILTTTKLVGGGVLVVLFGIMGDLGESIIKRDARMKDSGKIVLGHGGVLDRLDSLLLAAPALYFYLEKVLF